MRAVRLGLVGCGRSGRRHAAGIQGLSQAELALVCDPPAGDAARRLAEESGVRVAAGLDDLLAAEVDAVVLATPSGLHQEQAERALESGRHVLVEKPVSLSAAGARRLGRMAGERGLVAAAVHPLRFWPALRRVADLLQTGGLGRLSHAVCNVRLNRNREYYAASPWRGRAGLDGGMLYNQAVHHFDLLVWWLGDPEWVSASTAARLQNLEIEDVAVGVLGFPGGVLASFDVTTGVFGGNLEERVGVFGERGMVVAGGASMFDAGEWRLAAGADGNDRREGSVPHAGAADAGEDRGRVLAGLYREVLADFVAAVAGHGPPAVTVAEAARSLALLEAVYASSRAGRTVPLVGGEHL